VCDLNLACFEARYEFWKVWSDVIRKRDEFLILKPANTLIITFKFKQNHFYNERLLNAP
jgi:hypothetical protein